MRLHIAKSSDFNQMMVMSVFGHLLLMTAVLFIPVPIPEERVIVPTFMVELIDFSSGKKKASSKPLARKTPNKQPKVEKPVIEEPKFAIPQIKPEKIEVQKFEFSKIEAPIIEIPSIESPKIEIPDIKVRKQKVVKPQEQNWVENELNKLSGKLSQEAQMLEDLERLAKLPPEIREREAPAKKAKPIQDKTLYPNEPVKPDNVIPPRKTAAVPFVLDDSLDNFDELKMQNNLVPEKPRKRAKRRQESPNLPVDQDLELASLPRNMVELKKKKTGKTASDLLKELETMKPSVSTPSSNPDISPPVSPTRENRKELFKPILKKLGSLKVSSQPIDIDIASNKFIPHKFQSGIWNVDNPEVPVYETSDAKTSVNTDIESLPQADVLSLYIGLVQKRVYSNWKVTLGEKKKKKVAVSFRLFPNGKIEAPVVKESSGIRKLDDLAVQAIVNSEPFPQFPSEIKEPNLFLKIRFKYIPEKIKQ